jgi:hypothetical protein
VAPESQLYGASTSGRLVSVRLCEAPSDNKLDVGAVARECDGALGDTDSFGAVRDIQDVKAPENNLAQYLWWNRKRHKVRILDKILVKSLALPEV